jgi:hypothetical protein
MGGMEVQAELSREYRKAAEAATARGDWRRAAFIYGKLLHDYRAAAAVLERGGLHHDAGLVYFEKLSDALAAARAFEAAGEIDRALQLYRNRGDHVAAGDLLRRAGEEEWALEEYRLAAAHLAAADNHLAAGDLLRDRGQRPDLALEFFAAGWARRPAGTAQGCLMRLLDIRAAEESPVHLQTLIAEADPFFEPPGNDAAAAAFYNTLARLVEKEHLRAVKGDLRDEALTCLAHKLRQKALGETRPGNAVSTLLGQSGAWHAAVVSDAAFAFKKALRSDHQPRPVPAGGVRLRNGRVTAACAAPRTGRVFVGFEDGAVVLFDPRAHSGCADSLDQTPSGKVVSLAVDSGGDHIVTLHVVAATMQKLSSYTWTGATFRLQAANTFHATAWSAWLTPIAEAHGHAVVGLWHHGSLSQLSPHGLTRAWDFHEVGEVPEPHTILLFDPEAAGRATRGYVFGTAESYQFGRGVGRQPLPRLMSWRLSPRHDGQARPLAWALYGNTLEVAGIDVEGMVCWTAVPFGGPSDEVYASACSPKAGYTAVALLAAGHLAAVRPGRIDWLSRNRGQLLPWTSTPLDTTDPVACFHSPLTAEVLVITGGGTLLRVPVPH